MKSSNQHLFSMVPQASIPRSVFDLSHTHKTTFDEGYLVPFFWTEALPGDTFRIRTNLFARLTTQIVPIMDNMYMSTFFFSVPCRLVWANWKYFMGEKDNPADSTVYLVPTLNTLTVTEGSIFDHMGLPIAATHRNKISALPFRAYNLIWKDWFRDENLQNSPTINTGDGPDAASNYTLLKRGKRHDYFTSALPWPQKGTAVSIGIGNTAPVYGDGKALGLTDGTAHFSPFFSSTSVNHLELDDTIYNQNLGTATGASGHYTPSNQLAIGVVQSGHNSGLYADLSGASAQTINALREAFQLQRMMERDARGGTRYAEIIMSHFGVRDPQHAVLQRPEYLGGSTCHVTVTPIVQTSASPAAPAADDTPQGNLAGMAVASDSKGGFTKSFTEHCIVIGLVSIHADLSYMQGIPKAFSRQTRADHYFPALANLGEQAIYNREIYTQDTSDDDLIFGYQERWAEYRYMPNRITGTLSSIAATPLDVWHLGHKFTGLPALNASFIEGNYPVSRIVAIDSQPHFIFDSLIEFHAARPMPVYSVPGMIDHF